MNKTSKYKICVYAISKNEEKFVKRWMESAREADMVVVTDTGSTDATVELLRTEGAVVFEEKFEPWRFDTARNTAMSHLPDDTDICVSMDIDEVFEQGWRKKLEKAWKPDSTRAQYMFTWAHNPDSSPQKQFLMEKIHIRHGYKWVHPVHEILEYNGGGEEKKIWVEGVVLNHYPDSSKPRSEYLPLLELSCTENPEDDRATFWLGREYYYHGKYDQCINTLQKHLKLPSAKWDEERCASMSFIGDAYQKKGNTVEARGWYFRAVAECPRVRMAYMRLARLGYAVADWTLTYAMVKKTLAIGQKSGSYLEEPASWGYEPYDLGAIAAYRLGLYDESLIYAEKALSMDAENTRLIANMRLIEAKLIEKGQRV